MAALIYAPVLVVMAAGGLGSEWFWPLVLLIGLSSTVYTVIGGIRGVIVTDAIQFLLILTVLVVTIAYVAMQIPLGFGEVRAYLRTHSNLLTLNWSPDPTVVITVWAMGIGASLQNFGSFMADQMSLQRYLAAGSAASAARAFGTGMIATPLVLILLAAVGITLGAWYSLHPDPNLPAAADKVFPYFVATQLPAGFTGIVVAAILAATMSSVTSGINTLSGSLLSDFSDLSRRIDPSRLLRLARVTSAVLGVLATVSAGFMRNIGSIFDIMNIFFGVFLGPLLGCMFCAVTALRLKGFAMMLGLACGCAAGVLVVYLPVADLWVTAVSSTVTVAVAWLASAGSRRPADRQQPRS
jgi:sodium-coupled monocarboxylate transporter 8/12